MRHAASGLKGSLDDINPKQGCLQPALQSLNPIQEAMPMSQQTVLNNLLNVLDIACIVWGKPRGPSKISFLASHVFL